MILSEYFQRIFLLSLSKFFIFAQGHESKSCLLSNSSYAICSVLEQRSTIISKEFDKNDFAHHCQNTFIEKVLNHSCEDSTPKRNKPSTFQRYFYGFLAVFIVSALSLAGLLAFPIIYKVSFQYILTLFTALAVGTLFGDTMFHLIPFALGLHSDHGDDHHKHNSFSVPDYVWKMLLSVLILYSFYLLEVLLHSFAHYKHNNASSIHFHAHGHSHSMPHHSHAHEDGEACEQTPIDIDADLEHGHRLHNHRHHNLHQHVSNELNLPTTNLNYCHPNKDASSCVPCAYSNDVQGNNGAVVNSETVEIDQSESIKMTANSQDEVAVVDRLKLKAAYTPGLEHAIKSTGWMVLIGDGIHNFADGLAIGAAFSEDLLLGMTTTLAVAFHELPHELGDYAVLIQSGFSHYRAILWNFLSATTAFIGFFIGVGLSSDATVRQWIFAVTVGMFLYIALVDLLPTLLADGQVELKRFIIVNIGFLLGIGIMFLLALFEDTLIRSSN